MPERVSHYTILHKLGEGGMGIVYAARDERLGRTVALKMIGSSLDDRSRRRFHQEARTAARVSHPNICQVFEIGEEAGAPFITMELLEGMSLAERIRGGQVEFAEAVQIMLGVLSALEALHRSELVHRDLKPSNVFLTPHGVKLLDFGLARPLESFADDEGRTQSLLTHAGSIVGTPHYLAPEQIRGRDVDARADLFSAGTILFEMLTGRPAFGGESVIEILHAALNDQPPALSGSEAIAAVDRVLRRALAKKPENRHPTAAAMAQELRAVLLLEEPGGAVRARTMTRLIVLPFRILRLDPEIEFLAYSLPDVITNTLSGLKSLAVRSSFVAARFAGEAPDFRRIASEADVDVVLTGSLLRSGERMRVTTQLVEAPSGTVIWSHTTEATLGDVFALQDLLVRRIVESLALPLTSREDTLMRRDVPATAKAYEFYLRANRLSLETESWHLARELYRRCLDEDPEYAPAWARLGRIYRLTAKYETSAVEENLRLAESAFRRALEINPDLAVAHSLYSQFEVEAGRSRDALVRLLQCARTRSSDPEVFAGLVHACRYCGLLQASLAADRQARRLDPGVRTSVSFTRLLLGDYERVGDTEVDDVPFATVFSMAAAGRTDQAALLLRDMEQSSRDVTREIARAHLASLEGRRDECLESLARILRSGFRDPEGLYFCARALARLGETRRATDLMRRVVEGGFHCFSAFLRDPWLDPLRSEGDFKEAIGCAEVEQSKSARAFEEAGGERIVGLLPGRQE